MELASFVQSALVEIVTGVKDANKRLRESIQGNAYVLLASSNAKDAYVDFDVAVTVSKTDSTTAGSSTRATYSRAARPPRTRRSRSAPSKSATAARASRRA